MKLLVHCYGTNPHECLPHALAAVTGEYARRGLDVELATGPRGHFAPVSLGLVGATLERRRTGRRWRTVLPYTTAPLFWLRARADVPLESLRDASVAQYPVGSPVDLLTARALADVGIAPLGGEGTRHAGGVTGDLERLSALEVGSADLAVVGSGVSRSRADAYSTEVLFFGDVLRVPSAGLAVDTSVLDPESDQVRSLVASHVAALALIRSADSAAVACCDELIHAGTATDATDLVRDVLASTFDGGGARWPATQRAFAAWLDRRLLDPREPSTVTPRGYER